MNNTILIIDDIPDNVKLLLVFLSHKGFEVLVANDGQDGIETAEYAQPDIILLDIMMPGMDGFEVCQRLKSSPRTQDIPIIFMTAKTEIIDKVRGFKLGAADYITKPIEYEEVLARVNTHLTLYQQKKQIQEQNQNLTEKTSQLKQLTQQLHEGTIELEQRNQELDAFAHMVAHDLKNPLGGIVSLTEVLINTCSTNILPTEKWIERLHLVGQAGQQALNIIDALLLLAGVSRQAPVEFQELDMSHIVTKVIQQRLVHFIKQYQGQIDLPQTWPTVQSYGPWIEEIWMNYVSNGLKYGGNPPHLELGFTPQNDDMIRFWVRDNGQGLSKEEQERLFTPFIRLHKVRAEGHGLGLSIVQQIVEKLGGQAGVKSTLRQGSLFYFTLPINDSR